MTYCCSRSEDEFKPLKTTSRKASTKPKPTSACNYWIPPQCWICMRFELAPNLNHALAQWNNPPDHGPPNTSNDTLTEQDVEHRANYTSYNRPPPFPKSSPTQFTLPVVAPSSAASHKMAPPRPQAPLVASLPRSPPTMSSSLPASPT